MPIRTMLLTGFFTAFMIISSYLVIPIGVVPHTLQPLMVLLTGIVLGPQYGPLSIMVWILLGCLGLPVFNQGQAGIGMLLGPTGGFIIAFVAAAYIVGILTKQFARQNLIWQTTFSILAMLVLYIIGAVGFMFNFSYFLHKPMTWEKTFALAVAPFLPFDIIKAVVASYLGLKIRKALQASGFTLEK